MDKIYAEAMLVVLLGMISLLIGIAPSSAQLQDLGICWGKVVDCMESHANQSTTNPKFDKSSPSFNGTEFLCCPLIQQTAQTDKPCFCTVDTKIHQDPDVGADVTRALIFCNVTDSLASLDAFCSSSIASTQPSSNSTLSPPLAPVASPAPASNSTPSQTPEIEKSSPASGVGSSRGATTGNIKVIIAIVVPSAIVLLLLITIGTGFYCKKVKRKTNIAKSPNNNTAAMGDIITAESLQYDFGVLLAATNNFSNDHKIGQGGFGVVYKGTLANGNQIAVKRLSKSSGQGEKEFKNEVELLANLRHRNLVRLLGFCLAGDEELLVYEFVLNKSLDYFLFDPIKREQLNWPRRYDIIRGIARGMLYLHEDSPTRIIHRDLKAANILLDAEMNPKISDFGMSRMFNFEQTHISTSRVVGTYGYMAPEYLFHGQFSVKSDVYSFGVLVLEIVSGRRKSGLMYQSEIGQNLLSYAWKCWEDGRPVELMDPTLKDLYSEDEVIRCIHLGLLCVQEDINKRPTMAKIVLMLNSYSAIAALSMPQRPAFVSTRDTDQSTTIGSDSGNLRFMSLIHL